MKPRNVCATVTAFFLTAIVVYYYSLDTNGDDYVDSTSTVNLTGLKTILYWNDFFGSRDYFGHGTRPFRNCPIDACYATSDRKRVHVDDYDAIIFHAAEYSVREHGKPARRSPHQRYVFYSLETPVNRVPDKFVSARFYNWTMTYWRRSDIYVPYAKFIKRRRPLATTPSPIDESFVTNKTKSAVWFVSNCRTPSKRHVYAEELARHLDLDVYGACGEHECSKSDMVGCYRMIERKYRFYLSFENSFCEDYVTEKLYNVLEYGIVPIVYGAGNYTVLAPPHSVVETSRFATPKALADYLKRLSRDPREYLRYFDWKRDYVIDRHPARFAMCDLCAKLHETNDQPAKTYERLNDWWSGNCMNQADIKVPIT